MNSSVTPLVALKLGIIAVFVLGIVVMMVMGRLTPTTAVQDVGMAVSALVVALGVGSLGQSISQALTASADKQAAALNAAKKE